MFIIKSVKFVCTKFACKVLHWQIHFSHSYLFQNRNKISSKYAEIRFKPKSSHSPNTLNTLSDPPPGNYNICLVHRLIELNCILPLNRLRNFPQEAELWSEVRNLSDALQSDSTDENTLFLRGM